MEDSTEEQAEGNRAVWVQQGQEEEGEEEGGGGGAASAGGQSRKRPHEAVAGVQSDEDELEDDVKKRLAALRGQQ